MNTPLCDFCMKSGILCPKCQKKISSGKINKLDIRIAKLLLKLEKSYPFLQRLSFYKAYDTEDVLAIVVKSGDLPYILGYGGRIVRDLQKMIRKTVKVLERDGETRKFLEDLFMPATITAINKIWLPDGSTEIRVILPRNSRRMIMEIKALKQLAKNIRGITLRVEFQELNRLPLKMSMRRW